MFRRPALPPDIKEFRSLIKTGKLFAAQRWIAAGKRSEPCLLRASSTMPSGLD
jgi:hypothetical protein